MQCSAVLGNLILHLVQYVQENAPVTTSLVQLMLQISGGVQPEGNAIFFDTAMRELIPAECIMRVHLSEALQFCRQASPMHGNGQAAS